MRKPLSTLVAGFVFAIVHAASAQDARPEVWLSPRKLDFVPIIDGSAPEKPMHMLVHALLQWERNDRVV